jgi:tRNA nucleotidyltransferase (CCA-adding enzyme)|tara:strand:- start:4987 stop:6219 length:1233 start_codon:yes stop_codon:yes gene_type:complete
MQVYLVGGAVRDALLGYPFSDRDWVVVGSTPQQMLDCGYQSVGKDFPVFLHPDSHEEYALARTERKNGHGYKGFEVFAAPDVTLEQDLVRRDLTINAIAQDLDGNLFDPYHGVADINNKLLRHVSAAFTEDPLRVLRVARFAARYYHLGFRIADETGELMQQLAASGELNHLVGERIWQETHKALGEKNPEVYIQVLHECNALQAIMPELDQLFGVPQSAAHHPEIDTGVHSLMALKQACLLSSDRSVRFAALIHDLGKGTTPLADLPRHIAHEVRGMKIIEALCNNIKVPNDFRDLAKISCEFHTHIHRAFELKPATMLKVIEQCDAIRRPERFEHFLLVCEADAKGRLNLEQIPYPQADYFRAMLKVCQAVSPKQLAGLGLKGKEFGEMLRTKRVDAISDLKKTYISN